MRKGNDKISYPTRRHGSYTEIYDDRAWLSEDTPWGGDDHHCDMMNYEPSDEGLIEWVVGGKMMEWKSYGDWWEKNRRVDPFGIHDRMLELIERYQKIAGEYLSSDETSIVRA
jgi:hypothetical protein